LDDAGVAGAVDHDFIWHHTQGFDAVADDLRATSWADIERGSGLSRPDLEKVAGLYARSNATIVTYGLGFTQHNTGTANIHQVANLLLMRGNFGKPGAGIPTCRATAASASPRSLIRRWWTASSALSASGPPRRTAMTRSLRCAPSSTAGPRR